MAIDLHILGKRLAAARESASLTQEQAADAIGIPRSAVSLIESGVRMVSTLELDGFATLYRRPIAAFFDADPSASTGVVAHLRASTEFAARSDLQTLIAELLGVCREGVALEAMLNRAPRSGPPAYRLPAPKSNADAVEQAHAVAVEERRRLGLGDSLIPDMAELIAGQGIWTASTHLPDPVSGLFLSDHSFGFAIIVNGGHSNARKRFSFAHEYAHALLDRDGPSALIETPSAIISSRENSKQLIERRANAFAGAFLMPPAGVQALLASLRAGEPSRRYYSTYDVASDSGAEAERRASSRAAEVSFVHAAMVAHRFLASYQAACYRLKDLGVMSRDRLRLLLKQEETHARAYLELLPMGRWLEAAQDSKERRELSGQVVPLLVEALRAGEVTQSRVREIGKRLKLDKSQIGTILSLGDESD